MNIQDILLMNMYYNGNIKMENTMEYITKNKDYKIILSREELIKPAWSVVQNTKFKCNLEIKDNLNRDILKLSFNEVDALVMLDNMNEFAQETCIFDEYVLSGIRCPEDIYKTFNISLHTVWQEGYITHPKYTFLIEEINNYYQTVMPRISIEFDDDSLGSFMDALFFMYIIDIYDEMI